MARIKVFDKKTQTWIYADKSFGMAGKTSVKGVDYWTAADQESIVQEVITALGTPVFGTVDINNNIILTGELADGTYTIKYEDAEGEQTTIGTLEHTSAPLPSYTNLANPADSNWTLDKRYNSSNTLTTFTGGVITNYIDVSGMKNYVAVKGINMKGDNGRIYTYPNPADKPANYVNTTSAASITSAEYDSSVYIIPKSVFSNATNHMWRFGGLLTGTSADVIITIDEEIK